jgi:hypothetical protein
MRTKTIKNLIILFVSLFVTSTGLFPAVSSGLAQKNTIRTDSVSISVQSSGDTTTIHYTLGAFSTTPVMISGKQYLQIALGQEASNLVAGEPDLPLISRSIIIPNDATMTIHVIDSSYEEYTKILIAPSKGNLPRTIDPANVPYEFGDVYTQNTWYPTSLAELQEPYYLRDFRGQVVTIHPFQYNTVDATLRFYNDITVEISPTTHVDMQCVSQQKHLDNDFLPIYERHFINFETENYTPLPEQGNMLIITYDNFYDAMIPFVEWKNLKGIPTEIVNVSTIGDANEIKDFIANYYFTQGLTYVLLVGDSGQVPTLYQGGSASDPSYSYIVGNDHYPDLFVGRFSAETIGQVQTQVNRTITYEQDPLVGANWYKKGIGIGSEYGPGDDGEYDYEHIRNIRSLLLNFTYSYVDEFYGGTQGGQDAPGEPTASMITSALNDGRSIINYCGHGSTTSWGTSGYNINNVNQLINYNMFPFIFSVACFNGYFDGMTCFGEAWLRATHDGQPTGAIGAYMSSKSQEWNPPMQAQDEFNNILVGMYPDNQVTSFGALCYESAMSMNDVYGALGNAETDAWTVFGDPSVQVRTDTPTTMTVSHGAFIPYGSDEFDVSVPGVRSALCALSRQNALLGYGYADQTGHASIRLFTPINSNESLQLVVTGFNRIPYLDTILIGPPNYGPSPPLLSGPTSGKINIVYSYTVVSTDPENDTILYYADWGDGTNSGWLGPYPSGNQIIITHQWNTSGTYPVRAQAKDVYHFGHLWSNTINITIVTNHPPNTPDITGMEKGTPRTTYLYSFETTDSDNDSVYYFIDWGDNTTSGWLGPFDSGIKKTATHSWNEKGTYYIKIKAKDTADYESDWGLLKIQMPYDIKFFMRFADLLEHFFPRLFYFFDKLITE